MKAPRRKQWPESGQQIRLFRLDGCGGGLRRFCAIIGDSLLTSGVNSDALTFTPLSELEKFEAVRPDGRVATRWE